MSWIRRHCIECWHDMEHCDTCGCHDDMPAVSIESEQRALESNTAARKKAPAVNGGRPAPTNEESK